MPAPRFISYLPFAAQSGCGRSEDKPVERIKLLIIEDDNDQRELIRETLEQHFGPGTTVGVSSCAEALAQDAASFDLILSDYNLLDGSGIDLMEQIHRRCDTPVIIVTGENVGQIAAEAISRGATDYVVKLGDYLFTIPLVVQKNLIVAKVKAENEHLRRDLQAALSQVREKNAQLEESLKRVEEVAATDPLTGLYNRRHFGRVLDQLFAEASRYHKDLTCVMIDLDGYKKLNDTRGHQMGDQILAMAGRAISASMRTMDVAARYGGDEFILLLPHASATEAAGVAERISAEFQSTSARLLHDTGLTMSIGIGSLGETPVPRAEQLVALADKSLYQAKAAGKNRIIIAAELQEAPSTL